jgi:hypothetical protein
VTVPHFSISHSTSVFFAITVSVVVLCWSVIFNVTIIVIGECHTQIAPELEGDID